MNAAPCRYGLWVGLAALTWTGVIAITSPHCASTASHVDDEVGLLQVQANMKSGKDRAGKLPPGTPVRTSPDLPDEIHHSNTYLGDTDDDLTVPVEDSKDFVSGFTRLFVSPFANHGLLAKQAKSRSHPAAPKVYGGFNGKYCERRFGGPLNHHENDGNHGPEILNSVTAACIFVTGIYQLVFWNHQSAFIRLLCAIVVINGWSSALRHLTDNPFCAVLDGMTMVVGSVLGCCFMVDLAAQRARSWVTTAVLRMGVWAGMPVMFCLCIMRNPHSFDPHTSSMAFRVTFALPLLCVAIAVYGSLWCNWVTWTTIDDDALGLVKYYLRIGIPFCCIGATCMGLSELLCEQSAFAQYFPGHAMWHMLFPLGVNALLLYICALWADTKHQPMTFYKGATGWQAQWYAFAPAFSSGARVQGMQGMPISARH